MYRTLRGDFVGLRDTDRLSFLSLLDIDELPANLNVQAQLIVEIPFNVLVVTLPGRLLKYIAIRHSAIIPRSASTVADFTRALSDHKCSASCLRLVSVLGRPVCTSIDPLKLAIHTCAAMKAHSMPAVDPSHLCPSVSRDNPDSTSDNVTTPVQFPPNVHPPAEMVEFIEEWCEAVSEEALGEDPCGCCGRLSKRSLARLVKLDSTILAPLIVNNAVQEIIGCHDKPILCKAGIVGDGSDAQVRLCGTCFNSLSRKRLPLLALANGLWLGDIPDELKALNFVEKLLVARFRHNVCVARVAKGRQRKLHGNAIVFAQPVAKLDNILPPPKDDIQQSLVILFTGPSAPTVEDFKRTPFLVRHHVVKNALTWLKEHHSDYKNVVISEENLRSYPEDSPPVAVGRLPPQGEGNIPAQNAPIFSTSSEIGTETGMCSFSVGGLTGDQLSSLSRDEKVALAIRHILNGDPVLTYGRSSDPESIYNNPQLYPSMFPWLYPYGLGGFKNRLMERTVHRKTHIRALLMYHDQRFQTDEYFPFLVFNQDQIRSASKGGYLLTDKMNFDNVADRIMHLDPTALESLIEKGRDTGLVPPDTDEENACWAVMKLIEHVAGHVPGSITQKKYQRNEIQSLCYEKGAPVFFITFAPVDFKSPICLYYCGKQIDLQALDPANSDERLREIAKNPVACARFFNVMVDLFIRILLRPGTGRDGLFGRTSAYYGTVESQGRLTLHLHLLLWIEGSQSPLEIRNRLKKGEQPFTQALLDWLTSCHRGDFCTGTKNEIRERLRRKGTLDTEDDDQNVISSESDAPKNDCPPADASENTLAEDASRDNFVQPDCVPCEYGDPTLCLPSRVPTFKSLSELLAYWNTICAIVDEIIYRSNRHDEKHRYGCRRGISKQCRGQFPRTEYKETIVDILTGAIFFKKSEPWINTFSIVLSYVMRCNTDVTCLLSSTQAKAIIAYVTDYITKTSMKTHMIFETIRMVLEKNQTILADSKSQLEAARKLLTKMVNALTCQTEVGGPMVCALLLGQPDHYTNMKFKVFYWYQYVRHVANETNMDFEKTRRGSTKEKVVLTSTYDGIIPSTKMNNYIYRPTEFESWSLYDYLRLTDVKKIPKLKKKTSQCDEIAPDDGLDDINIEGVFPGDDTNDAPNEEDQSLPTEQHKYYQFLDGHPSQKTHAVWRLKEGKEYVLNYVGGPLPRVAGDREEYCMSMLTFFKPGGWRTGKDLKLEDQTWDDAFTHTNFPDRPLKVMANMNLMYECYDARHDYAAQRRAKDREALTALFSEDTLASLDNERKDDTVGIECVDGDILDLVCDSGEKPGKDFLKVQHQMLFMTEELTRLFQSASKTSLGDKDNAPVGVLNKQSFVQKSPTEWKEVLTQAKENIVNDRLASLRSRGSSEHATSTHDSVKKNLDGQVAVATLESVQGDPMNVDSTCDRRLSSNDAMVGKIIQDYNLNKDQVRAFQIIERHLVNPNPSADRLHMYLGGTGGTGKSRVITSVIDFLKARDEGYRYIVLAPTGTAACLVDGSTYHSALKININGRESTLNQLTDLKDALNGVDVIFIDEVSMVSCYDLYCISSQLSKAFETQFNAFRNKHVVLAGDFGQLSPAGMNSMSLYNTRTPLSTLATSLKGQQNALGRALWQFFTTVVILRENMRQKSMSQENIAFKTALNNMRYGACTPTDIRLLNSRIIDHPINNAILRTENFRNASIITAWNSHRDSINSDASRRYALQTGQTLKRFYSVDTSVILLRLGGALGGSIASMALKKKLPLTQKLRETLWKVPPSLTGHLAGVLKLCIGLPVILKTNEATELCATNGADGIVVGWDSYKIDPEHDALKTLFVKLTKPPRDIQLPDLPKNVVPMTASPNSVECLLSDDSKVRVTRTQVNVLPNFAITDYGSQGKTRPYNLVDLRNLKNHQSIYTALSRSSDLQGTLILFPFNTSKITRGATGDLRREFRDLEILDDITTMRFENRAPEDIPLENSSRITLINWYKEKFGARHVPNLVHPALDWSANDENAELYQPLVPFKDMEDNLHKLWEEKYHPLQGTTKTKVTRTAVKNSNKKNLEDAPQTSLGKRDRSGKENQEECLSDPARDSDKLPAKKKSKPSPQTVLGKRNRSRRENREDSSNPVMDCDKPPDKKKSKHTSTAPVGKQSEDNLEIKNHRQDSVKIPQSTYETITNQRVMESACITHSKEDLIYLHPWQSLPSISRSRQMVPTGPNWDYINWSCAYDALICILWNTYQQYPVQWTRSVSEASQYFSKLSSDFFYTQAGLRTLESVRDELRDEMSNNQPLLPRVGSVLTDISILCNELFTLPISLATKTQQCCVCGTETQPERLTSMHWTCYRGLLRGSEILGASGYFEDLLQRAIIGSLTSRRCLVCQQRALTTTLTWNYAPPWIVLELQPDPSNNWSDLKLESNLDIEFPAPSITYRLVGAVYLADAHFTCRFRDKENQYWFFDSALYAQYAHLEKHVASNPDTLKSRSGSRACLLVYLKMS